MDTRIKQTQDLNDYLPPNFIFLIAIRCFKGIPYDKQVAEREFNPCLQIFYLRFRIFSVMSRRTLRVFIFLGVISILGVLTLQVFWLKNAFSFEDREFNDRVNLALRRVANVISIMNKEERQYQQVTQVSSNYFVVSMNDSLHPYLLERLLKMEFDRRNIREDFEYVIYDCFTSKIVFSKYIPQNAGENTPETVEPPKWDKDNHYFGVYFPNKSRFLIFEMGIWWFSSGVLLLVVAFFGYSMSVILRQKKLSEIRNDFINNMTHEFKTPVSTISITGEMLAKKGVQNDQERIARYASIITEETTRLRNMVERLLQMSAYDREVKLNLVKLDIHEVIEHSVQSMELLLNDRKGSISCQLQAPNHILEADKVHLTNVIYNLLDNAIKYSVEEPKIEIKTFNSKRYLHIQIKDNGIGMSKDAQKHIFNKFYRVSTGNIHKVKGFGLGLNYVKLITKAHHGFVKLVESIPGKGSTFEVCLKTKD